MDPLELPEDSKKGLLGLSAFGLFLLIVGLVVGLGSASYITLDIFRRGTTRKRALVDLGEAEKRDDDTAILRALGELQVRDYARDAKLRERVYRHLKTLGVTPDVPEKRLPSTSNEL